MLTPNNGGTPRYNPLDSMQKRFDEAKDQILLAMKDTPAQDRQQIAQGGAELLRKCGANSQADEILKAAESR